MPDLDRSTVVWNREFLANPHAVADKRRRVQQMFAAIAPSYDLNNRLHSLWMDQSWRRKAVKLADLKPSDVVIDVACGTGDLTLQFQSPLAKFGAPDPIKSWASTSPTKCSPWRAIKSAGQPHHLAQRRRPRPPAPRRLGRCHLHRLRHPQRLRPRRRHPRIPPRPTPRRPARSSSNSPSPSNPLLRSIYNFYFRRILPRTATWISRDKTGAYKYLPESVNTFIDRRPKWSPCSPPADSPKSSSAPSPSASASSTAESKTNEPRISRMGTDKENNELRISSVSSAKSVVKSLLYFRVRSPLAMAGVLCGSIPRVPCRIGSHVG